MARTNKAVTLSLERDSRRRLNAMGDNTAVILEQLNIDVGEIIFDKIFENTPYVPEESGGLAQSGSLFVGGRLIRNSVGMNVGGLKWRNRPDRPAKPPVSSRFSSIKKIVIEWGTEYANVLDLGIVPTKGGGFVPVRNWTRPGSGAGWLRDKVDREVVKITIEAQSILDRLLTAEPII